MQCRRSVSLTLICPVIDGSDREAVRVKLYRATTHQTEKENEGKCNINHKVIFKQCKDVCNAFLILLC